MEDDICFNKLVVRGSKDQMEKFFAVLKSGDSDFQMEKFLPVPEELSLFSFPNEFQPNDKKEVVSKLGKATLVDVDKSGRTRRQFNKYLTKLENQFGCSDCDVWCEKNWGCIWDVFDTCESSECSEDYYSVTYMTEGNPNLIFVRNTFELYPELTFTLDYRTEENTGGTFKISPGFCQFNVWDYNVIYFGYSSNTLKYSFLDGNEHPYDKLCVVYILDGDWEPKLLKKGITPDNVENWDKVIEYFNL